MSMKTWCEIHSYVSMFFLPVAVIFAITGGILALEEHGRPGGQELHVRAGQAAPNGYGRIERGGPGGPPEEASAVSGERAHGRGGEGSGLLFTLKMLHKAKSGVASKALTVSFGVAMLVIYLSGIWMCWCNNSRRKQMLGFGLAGLIVTVAVILLG